MSAAGLKSAPHATRCGFLSDLATLAGFHRRALQLPDGRIPDVLRFSEDARRLFLGDAKATETPGNSSTQARLYAYCRSIAAYLDAGGTEVVFAICFGNVSEIAGWMQTLELLCREANLQVATASHTTFAPRIHIVCFRLVTA